MKFSLRWLVAFGIFAIFFWQCGENNPFAPDMPSANEVWIQNQQFVPQSLPVSKGTTVQWTNKDDEVHTVDSGEPMNPTTEFNLTVKAGETEPWPFTNTGNFDYYCGIHGETGTIVVQ